VTFEEWQEKYLVSYEEHESGIITIPDNHVGGGEKRVQLYELSDYIVSSVEAGAIWLVRRY
jgi:hypothetical protein